MAVKRRVFSREFKLRMLRNARNAVVQVGSKKRLVRALLKVCVTNVVAQAQH
jgi:hypothetical protein